MNRNRPTTAMSATPWEVFGGSECRICEGGPLPRYSIGKFECPADAQRAVACVNALEGITNPEEFVRAVETLLEAVTDVLPDLPPTPNAGALCDALEYTQTLMS